MPQVPPTLVRPKVLIYATSVRGLLVFDEPDFPEAPLQVPGGTVEAGEDLLVAARREFREETGLSDRDDFRRVGTSEYSFLHDGMRHVHQRTYFHVTLPGDLPESWFHHEETPDAGGEPILFRLFWLSLSAARTRLGIGMGEYLDRLEHSRRPRHPGR